MTKNQLNFIFNHKDWIKIWEFYFSLWFLDRLIDVHLKYPKCLGYENRNTLHIYEENKESAFFLEKEIEKLKSIRQKKILSRRYIETHYRGAKEVMRKMRHFVDNQLFLKKLSLSELFKRFLKYSALLEDVISYYRASRPELFEIVEEEMKKPILTKEKRKYLKALIPRYGKLRLALKGAWLEGERKSKKLKENLAKHLGLKHKEMEQLTSKEITTLYQGKLSLSEAKEIIRQRKFCVFGVIKGKKIFLTAGKAKKIAKYIAPLIKQAKTISGKVAYPGIVTGKVRVIPQTNYQEMVAIARKLKKGEVMVTGMTQPDVMMAIKKSKAIITDEGGITSHAAIVSRELNKPCIIGTKIATKVLKDGDLVEVDANRGIVKILKRR